MDLYLTFILTPQHPSKNIPSKIIQVWCGNLIPEHHQPPRQNVHKYLIIAVDDILLYENLTSWSSCFVQVF